MFKAALIFGALASPAFSATGFDISTLDCEVIYVFISAPQILSDLAVVGIDAALQGAMSTMPGSAKDIKPKISEACRADPTLSLGIAIRKAVNQ